MIRHKPDALAEIVGKSILDLISVQIKDYMTLYRKISSMKVFQPIDLLCQISRCIAKTRRNIQEWWPIVVVVVVYFSDMFHLTQYRNTDTWRYRNPAHLGLTSHIDSNLTGEDMDI